MTAGDHDHGELWAYISGLREDLGRAEERVRELEDSLGLLGLALREISDRHDDAWHQMASDDYIDASRGLADVLGDLADALAGQDGGAS